ncbi:spore coat protein GerQ [Bacillus salitolerans]|uniref:Spore coat protein GerQ n=1 Tax=Bacillus salitolerans TaxID=1437434 RepID=A0ABW4LJ00_9BACI
MAQKYSQANPYAYYGTQAPGYPAPATTGYGSTPAYTDPSSYNPLYSTPLGGPLVSPGAPNVGIQNPAQFVPGMLPLEESYIENILRLNKGKLATAYLTFGDRNQKSFTGIVEAAGRDHLILSDPQTGMRYLLLMVYLDYVTFDEELEYEYPNYPGAGSQLAAYPPR